MELYSTNHKAPNVSLREALFRGLPPDNGLYLPVSLPTINKDFVETYANKSIRDIAFEVSSLLFADEIDQHELKKIVDESINFEAPLEMLDEKIYIQELFHGPTLAFKDFGARFMARLMQFFAKKEENDIKILVATSGDTGSAVAHGFLGIPGFKVIVLYPKGKVSDFQEKQFTTLGKNVIPLEVDGTFDDCQKMVKQAFLDTELNNITRLTSANSINIGRLIPQTFYYFYAYLRLAEKNKPIVFSVPSGNFGNLCAGLIAKKMGLPIEGFIAATNINDIVPKYLSSGVFEPRPSKKTISNAMDVGNPSNFARIAALYQHEHDKISKDIHGGAFTDDQTKEMIHEVSARYEYTTDPHTAVGILGLKQYLQKFNDPEIIGVVLATAHPTKFMDIVEDATGSKVIIPDRMLDLLNKKKLSIGIDNDYQELKDILISV